MEKITILTLILAAIAMGIYFFFRDRVILREKIDGITGTDNQISDLYNIGNTRAKFVTHYASGRKKVNYLSESGKTVIVWLSPEGVEIHNYTCGVFREIYYLVVIMLWCDFGVVKITQAEQFERLIKSKTEKKKEDGFEKSF